MQRRVSQRRSLACIECTKRKRKCDRQLPCSRCLRLGLECRREPIYLRRHLNQHASEVAFLRTLRRELSTRDGSEVTSQDANALLLIDGRIQLLQSGDSKTRIPEEYTELVPDHSHSPTEATSERFPRSDRSSHDTTERLASSAQQHNSIVTALEHIAWGRSYGGCFPHRRCACQHRHSGPDEPGSTVFQLRDSSLADYVAGRLPDPEAARTLIEFHDEHILWHHNCLHAPTFWQECRRFWDYGECVHPHWLALYCSTLATALLCLRNSRRYREALPLDATLFSPRILFDTMVDVLVQSQFLHFMSLYAIQAIVISTETAHTLGLSQLNATLLSAGVRMAECYGLHKIDQDPTDAPTADEPSSMRGLDPETVEREVGRRVWLQMVIQDHFASPFTDSYINPAHYSTGMPMNANDSDLAPLPEEAVTSSSYTRVLGRIAHLMPRLNDGMGPLRARKPLASSMNTSLPWMRKCGRSLEQSLASCSRVTRCWNLGYPGFALLAAVSPSLRQKRPVIFQSFQLAGYSHTRGTCVSAALTILREHQNISEAGELSIWTHTAFAITAALILCFARLFSHAALIPTRDTYILPGGTSFCPNR